MKARYISHWEVNMAKTKAELLLRQRVRRKENNNLDTRRYEKTKKGFLMRLYRNMQSRITGVQSLKAHLYVGKSLLPRSEFYEWAIDSPEFHELFDEWTNNNYDRKLTPSVDRVNSSIGYELNNMEWVTHSENSRRGAVSERRTQ